MRVAIVGAGIAGASTAWFLAQRGVREVALFEREKDPGAHSTARNAAILRTAVEEPELHALAAESAGFYRDPPPGFADRPLLDPVGLFLAAPASAAGELAAWAGRADCAGAYEETDPEVLYRQVPLLRRDLARAWHQPREGVLDVAGILAAFLHGARAAGAELRTDTPVTALECEDGRVTGVVTPQGEVRAEQVVLAGGAWASELADQAGCGLPLTAMRRHLLVTEPLAQVDPRWPVVWIAGDEFYFRPESGGLLACPCDVAALPPDQCEQPDPAQIERAAEKTSHWLPALADAGAAHFWSGARTFAADGRFVLGADPRMKGLFWAAGLGGHGITCAPAVGRVLAEWLTEGRPARPAEAALGPERLLAAPQPRA